MGKIVIAIDKYHDYISSFREGEEIIVVGYIEEYPVWTQDHEHLYEKFFLYQARGFVYNNHLVDPNCVVCEFTTLEYKKIRVVLKKSDIERRYKK